MRSHIAPSWLVWKHSTSTPSSLPSAAQLRVDLGERDRPVLLRVALAEHVEVDAVEHEDVHRGSRRAGVVGTRYGPGTGRFRSGSCRTVVSTMRPVFAASAIASVTRRFSRPSRALTIGAASPRTTAPKCSIWQDDRVVADHVDAADLERLPPGPLGAGRIGPGPHRRHGEAAMGAGDEVAVLVVAARRRPCSPAKSAPSSARSPRCPTA